jgi:hypothetical protein
MTLTFEEIRAKYPKNFSGFSSNITFVPNFESFIGQLFFIRSVLRRNNIINCNLDEIGYIDTEDEFAYGIPTYGRYYVYNKYRKFSGCPFPKIIKKFIPANEKEFNLLMLSRSWNEPEKIVMKIIIDNRILSTGKKTNPQLLYEMFRYSLILKIIKLNNSYQALNIFERWLITAADDYQETDQDYIFDKRKLKKDYHTTSKMAEELVEKNLPLSILDDFLSLIRTWLNSKNNITYVNLELIGNVMKLVSNTKIVFLYTFPQEMYLALLIRGTPEELACVCLRYACILSQAHHWAKTNEFYKIMVNQFGASIEGFSSPLNSRIILQSYITRFCSLFPDVDAPFGSVGSFYNQDLVGKVVTVHPPYIVSMFDKILEKVKRHIQEAIDTDQPMLLTFGMPSWMDDNLVQYLETNEHLKYKRAIYKNEYTYVDTKYDSYAPATFSNRDYIISVNIDDNTYTYKNTIGKYFDDCKVGTTKLVQLQTNISRCDGFDFQNIGVSMNNFNAKFIADTLRVYGKIEDVMDIFKDIPSASTLAAHLLADAFVNLDPKNTMKYSRSEVLRYVKRKAERYLHP